MISQNLPYTDKYGTAGIVRLLCHQLPFVTARPSLACEQVNKRVDRHVIQSLGVVKQV
jgi:hypothetical protein